VGRYLLVRVVEMVPTLFIITVAAFLILQLVPGDPARISLGLKATPQQVADLRASLGLNKSLPAQYWQFISGAVTLDFGTSFSTREEVAAIIGRRMGPSLLLVPYSLLISLLLATPLAIIAAVRRSTWVDQGIRFFSTVAFVMPAFWLALLLITVFSLQLGLLPTSGYGDTFPDHMRSLTLPALTVALALSPVLLRVLRSTMIDTMQHEYIEAARARGLSEVRVVIRHVLRVSMLSTVTLIGVLFGVLLSATVVVEQIFAIPGLGSLLVSAVSQRDFPVVRALVLLSGIAVLVVSLITDVAYATLDPRVRL
jgi:peptide/nickel transport system permease protein